MMRHLLLARAAPALAAALLALCAADAKAGFSGSLSPMESAMAGLGRLAPAQVAALDAQVDRDVASAHEGGVTAFASGFCARRTPRERAQAGIDRLTGGECASLDALVARQIACGPPPAAPFVYAPAAAAVQGEFSMAPAPRPEVHGDVSLTLGGGRGTSFYGTSADVFVTDPSGRFTLGIGVSEFRGKGFIGPCLIGPYEPLPGAW